MTIDYVFVLRFKLAELEALDRNRDHKYELARHTGDRTLLPGDDDHEAIAAVRQEIAAVPGVSELEALCNLEGAKWGSGWIDLQLDKLQIDYGLQSSPAMRMRIPDFAAKLLECRRLERHIAATQLPVGKVSKGGRTKGTGEKAAKIKKAIEKNPLGEDSDIALQCCASTKYVKKIRGELEANKTRSAVEIGTEKFCSDPSP